MCVLNTGLPVGWKRVSIGDICDLKNGYAFKPTDWSKSGLPIIRIQNLNNPNAAFNYYSGELRDRFIVQKGDLLFAWSGTPGTSFGAHIWRGERAALNQHIFRIDFDDETINKKYFRLAINQKLASLIERAHGGVGLRHVTKGKFEETFIELPPLKEQHRIVANIEELFSELDNGVAVLKTAREQLKVYRQSLLKQAFEGKLTAQWREENKDKLETPEQLLARIQQEREARYQQQLEDWKKAVKEWEKNDKQDKKPRKPRDIAIVQSASKEELSALPSLPKNWLWVRPETIAAEEDYAIGIGPFGSNLKVSDYRDSGVPLIFVRNITRANFSTNLKYIDLEKYEELAAHSVTPLDLVITKMGDPPGDCEIYPANSPLAVLTADCLKFRIFEKFADRRFYKNCINSNMVKRQLGLITKGVAQKKISVDRFKTILLPLPPLEEQTIIANRIAEIFSIIENQEKVIDTALAQSETLRQSILKKAFSGKLVSQGFTSELVDQIKPPKAPNNVIPFPVALPGISGTDLHAGIIAMAYRLHEQTPDKLDHFGHVKAEKISHLVEAHLGLSLGRQPVKDAAGPNDYPHLKKVEHRASKANWFDVKQKTNGQYVFIPKKGFDRLLEKTHQALDSRLGDVENLLQLMLPMTMRQAEILATVYAAWNNLLLIGKEPSDEEIVKEARENWHQSKLNIARDKFFTALNWMRKKSIVPSGRGHLVKEKNGQKA